LRDATQQIEHVDHRLLPTRTGLEVQAVLDRSTSSVHKERQAACVAQPAP
jgi:hypothetical protein